MHHSSLKSLIIYICKIRFAKYPPHFFPVYLILKFLQEFDFKFTTRKLNFQLISIPNKYFDFLCREHEILSDHTIFINRRVFDYYIYQKDVNFVNLHVSEQCKLTQTEKIIKKVVNSSQSADINWNLYQVFPLDIPINKIFIKENSFFNFIDKHKVSDDNQLIVNLSMLQNNQKIPEIATKCNVFLINSPYELSNSLIDDIFKEYFRRPRLIYRNHTYRVDLTEDELGNFIFCENFSIISKVKRVYFKCVHLESRLNIFDTCAIVTNQLTTLNLTTTINYRVPSVNFDHHYVTIHPYGLSSIFDNLKSSIEPYLHDENAKFLKSRKIYPIFNISGDRGCGKRKIITSIANHFGLQIYFAECCEIMTSLASTTEQKILYTLHRATNCNPIILCFNDFEYFGRNNEGHEDDRVINFFKNELMKIFKIEAPIIVVALSNSELSGKLNEIFLETIHFKPLDKDERFKCLLWHHQREVFDRMCYAIKMKKIDNYITYKIANAMATNDVKILKSMAEQTTGFLLGDLRILYERSASEPCEEDLLNYSLSDENFKQQLSVIKKCFSDSIGTPEIPKVMWDDIGGLANLKTEIQNSIGLPLKYSHLLGGKNMKRSGILLFGPPGTGKTLIAKAVATECNLNFISVQGPELLNMYVGQSEQNVREVFSKARSCAPSVIFLDELDSLAPNRGVAGDSGGVMDRVVSQLLSEMDGVDDDPKKPVFILGATNRPDLIDKQLLRPGRFDKMLYVGPCVSVEDKELVLKALTKKFHLKREVSVRKIAELVNCDVTGADLYSICSNAWLCAVRKHVKSFESGKCKDVDMSAEKIHVGIDDFKKSMNRFVSSLNQVDMEYFQQLQANFS